MKNIIRIVIGFSTMLLTTGLCLAADAETTFWVDRIDPALRNWWGDLVITANNIFAFIIGLFYFIAVVFAIYAGFTILTWAGDEEKLKKWKNILIYVVLGLIVIFLASTIIRWVIATLSNPAIV